MRIACVVSSLQMLNCKILTIRETKIRELVPLALKQYGAEIGIQNER
jgi:hypothetical protein